MTAILHTASGATLPVDFQPLRRLTLTQYSKAIKQAYNNSGMLDKVIWVEVPSNQSQTTPYHNP